MGTTVVTLVLVLVRGEQIPRELGGRVFVITSPLPCFGVREGQTVRPKANEGGFFTASVLAVPHKRKPTGGKLYTDLVGASRMQTDENEGMAVWERREDTAVQNRLLTSLTLAVGHIGFILLPVVE